MMKLKNRCIVEICLRVFRGSKDVLNFVIEIMREGYQVVEGCRGAFEEEREH